MEKRWQSTRPGGRPVDREKTWQGNGGSKCPLVSVSIRRGPLLSPVVIIIQLTVQKKKVWWTEVALLLGASEVSIETASVKRADD